MHLTCENQQTKQQMAVLSLSTPQGHLISLLQVQVSLLQSAISIKTLPPSGTAARTGRGLPSAGVNWLR